jgi:hypothetical protein
MLARPGKIAAIPDLLKKQRNVWKSDSASVAVYVLVASGDPGYLTVTRLRGGLKEMASDYRKPLKERFTAANGEGSYDAFLKDYAEDVQSRWSELLVYKPLLSSK